MTVMTVGGSDNSVMSPAGKTPARKRKPSAGSLSAYSLSNAFAHADKITWISAVVMGAGTIIRRQIIKGVLFLIGEILFIYLLVSHGIACLAGLGDLGPVTQSQQEWTPDGQYVNVNPTNSVEVLLYGVAWIFIIAAFVLLWTVSFKSAYKAQIGQVSAATSKRFIITQVQALVGSATDRDAEVHKLVDAFRRAGYAGQTDRELTEQFKQACGEYAERTQTEPVVVGRAAPAIVTDLKELLDSRLHGTLLTLPALGILIFTIVPLVFMMAMAFTTYDSNHTPAFNWTGVQNFVAVFSKTGSVASQVNVGQFVSVLVWTLVWAFLSTFLNFFLGMFLAMIILRRTTRLKGLWRGIFSLSMAVPQFVSLLVINQMLTNTGIINQMLKNWGWIDASLPFLSNGWWARATVIIVNLWIGIPYTIMQVTGILQNVPAELYEASKIDGASWWQTYIHVTMPYIFFVMTPYLITTFTGNINNFNVIYLLTNGQPTKVGNSAGQTDLLITWLYKLSVDRSNYNIGAVIGILTFVVLAIVSLITYRSSGSYRNEEEFR